MNFFLVDKFPQVGEANTAYLLHDSWDDWFKYATTYHIVIFDATGKRHEPGNLKIGQQDLKPMNALEKANQECPSSEIESVVTRIPNLPKTFTELPSTFFSLGENQNYYETISNIENSAAIYKALRDCAYDLKIFAENKDQEVMQESLLRGNDEDTIEQRLHPLANGNAILTPYRFLYQLPNSEATLEINVIPKSSPPTNIHIIIGRNGVGKTRCLQNLFKAASYKNSHDSDQVGIVSDDKEGKSHPFSQVVVLAFSSFDKLDPPHKDNLSIPLFIFGKTYFEYRPTSGVFGFDGQGLPFSSSEVTEKSEPAPTDNDQELWAQRLFKRIRACLYGPKKNRLYNALVTLENDPIFSEINTKSLLDSNDDKELWEKLEPLYRKLSSGHSIVLQIIAHLVAMVDEKSLVLLDEPEEHLHPPLLSAFTRAFSDLLINRNAVALVATHSPIMLQEVPQSCVYRLNRSGQSVSLTRPTIETFGESIGTLTSDIFQLEVKTTGFIQMLKDAVIANPDAEYAQIANDVFGGQLGSEARSILMALVEDRETSD